MTMNFEASSSNQIEIANDMNKYTVMLAVPKHSAEENKIQSRELIFSGLRMNAFNIFVLLSVALLLSASTTQGAAIGSSNSTEAPTTQETLPASKICHSSTPCGWAVYIPFTRRVDYFMKNTCVCPPEKACLKSDDDLSVSAYVYRCGNRPPSEPEPIEE